MLLKRFVEKKYIKRSFTLAEVLVTLAVIGVVASMTIPALQKNINQSQFEAGFKTNFSALNAATSRIKNEEAGGNLKGFCDNPDNRLYSRCLADYYKKYMTVHKECREDASTECWHGNTYDNLALKSYNNSYMTGRNTFASHASIIFDNGALLSFSGGYHNAECKSSDTGEGLLASFDFCTAMILDVNGHKKPNQIGHDVYFLTLTPEGIKIPDTFGCDKAQTGNDGIGYSCATNVLIGK